MIDNLDIVLKNCPHYDEIIKFIPKDNNEISRGIINYYQNYIFINYKNIEEINKLDSILNEYITNRDFYNYLNNRFIENGDVLPIYDELLDLYLNYLNSSMKKIDNAKWI